jgi:hypothetical protein
MKFMRLVLAALMVALLTVPSAAQFKSMGQPGKEKEKDNAPPKKNGDEGYKSAIERLPDQKFDPWRNMR